MRVALLGNMNNNFFAIARWLRKEGIDAHVFYNSINFQFEPKADTFRLENLEFCHTVDWWKSYDPLKIDKNQVREILSDFDCIIGQGNEAAYAWAAGFKSHIYYPYGSDFYKYAQPPYHYSLKEKISAALPLISKSRISFQAMKFGTFGVWQKGVITNADYVFMDYSNPVFESKLLDLGMNGVFENYGMPFLFYPEYQDTFKNHILPPVHFADAMNQLRKDHRFILLYHGRQEWKNAPNPITYKNVDRLIRGFALLLQKNSIKDALLVMLEYGSNVADSKELILELGIESNVKWFPTLYRKDLMYLIRQADLCSGEFGRSYLTFGTIMEAFSMRKPIIHYLDESYYEGINLSHGIYPLLNAKESTDIADRLLWAYQNPEQLKEMGNQSFNWFDAYFIQRNLKRLFEALENLK